MAEYYRDRNEATNIYDDEEKNKKIYNIITCAADFISLDHNKTRTLLNNDEFINFAQEHGEMNMLQLFKYFHFPIPETEEEKNDPRFCLHLLYKKDSDGELIPRENIYYYEKNIKGYKNPLKSTYTLLDNGTKIDNQYIKPLNREENLNELKKTKLNKTISNLRKSIYNRNDLNGNGNNKKLLQYELCMKYYANQPGFQDIKKIDLEKITSLGQIYYLIKKANEVKDASMNPFNDFSINQNKINFIDDDEDENDILSRNCFNFGIIDMKNKIKEDPKKTFIDKLLQNSKIADKNFGYLSVKQGESQLIFKDFCDIKMDSNDRGNNNIEKDTDSQLLLNKFNNLILTTQKKNKKDSVNGDNFLMDINSNLSNKNNNSQYGEDYNNLLYDDYRLLLILKGKRIDYSDWQGKNRDKYFFKFYIENKLLNTMEVIFNPNVAKEEFSKFKKVMNKVKINEEIIVVFAYNPTLYFNIRYMNYDFPASGVESVFYIDSSKENQNVTKIFEEINK